MQLVAGDAADFCELVNGLGQAVLAVQIALVEVVIFSPLPFVRRVGVEEDTSNKPLNPGGADLFDDQPVENIAVFNLKFLPKVLDLGFNFGNDFLERLVNRCLGITVVIAEIANGFEG